MFRIRGFGFLLLILLAAVSLHAQQQPLPERAVPRLSHAFSPHRTADVAMTAALPDTIRLLAVMVEFQEDADDRTSGTGKFGTIYQYDYGTEILDPMPHDRAFFQQHLLFLENYVRKVSGRRTILKGTVLDGIVTVDKPLGEYSFKDGESESPVAQLAVDAWTAAGQQFASFPFGAYDMFVVFHAGRGRDIDLVSIQGYDPTPLDIPSLSFTMESFQRLLGSSFSGISMPDGSSINNCAVIPTTNNREIPLIDGSTGLLELTTNGLLAASFGTWAGLPDLFDTETGKTGIGRFGLMDGEGIFAYGGICPPEPSAWEKQLLGWTIPREAMPGKNNYLMTASDSLTTPDVLRVPISGDEYWLVENRQRDLGGNGQSVTIVSGGQTQTLRFPKDTTGFQNSDVSQLKGVIIDVEDIDWSLPGGRVLTDDREARINGGLLIWHIDESVITAYRSSNSVNTGDHPRGVDLEQAGGPQDIGEDIETVFGTETGTGSALDYWRRDNISPVYTNSFGMFTAPNTRANSGAFTHVTMDNFSSSAPIMSLDVALGDNTIAPLEGWPVDLSTSLAENRSVSITTADLDADGIDEILAVFASDSLPGASTTELPPDSVKLFVLRQDGTPFLSTGALCFVDSPARVATTPTVGDWDGDGVAEIALVTKNDVLTDVDAHVWLLSPDDSDNDGMFDIDRQFLFPAENGNYLLCPPTLVGNHLLFRSAGADNDTMYVVTSDITRYPTAASLWSPDLPRVRTPFAGHRIVAMNEHLALLIGGYPTVLFDVTNGSVVDAHDDVGIQTPYAPIFSYHSSAAADYDGDGNIETMYFVRGDPVLFSRPDDQNVRTSQDFGTKLPYNVTIPHVAAADVDGDGRMDALLSSGTELRALNYAYSTVNNYPVSEDIRFALSANLGSQEGDAVFGVGERQVWQFRTGAHHADGFPVPIPSLADVALLRTASGKLGIAAASPNGNLLLFETANAVTDDQLLWRSRQANAGNNCAVLQTTNASNPTEDFFPEQRCYPWPNPTYDNISYIRVYVSVDADVNVKIYDLAGDKVDEVNGSAVGGVDTDLAWDVSGIESDVYLAHVKVTAGSRSEEKIIKIAVVK
ncbi:hypothetical protein KQI65_17380 [bacterium]|nr:hypothetical protein [bacterium]